MNGALLVLLPLMCLCTQNIGSVDSGLDPGRIRWWKEQWVPSPISVSSAHVGASLTLTFHIRVSTSVSNGVLEVTLPSGVTQSGLSSYSTSVSLVAGAEDSISIPNVSVTTAGRYGPFQLLTRSQSTGQIIDINISFGSIVQLAAVGSSSSLLVAGADAAINSSGSLTFTITINSDLWKYDPIVITPSSYYTIGSAVTCTSSDLVGPTASSTTIPCAKDNDKVVIYGISSDITVSSSYTIAVTVTGFTFPDATYTTGYSWNVSVYRFATNVLLAEFTSTTPPLTLAPGEMTVSAWEPLKTYAEIALLQNLQLFMKVSVTTANAIPNGGYIEYTFSGVDVQTPNWWYGDSDLSNPVAGRCVASAGHTCTVMSSTVIKVDFSSGATANYSLDMIFLPSLGATPTLVSVTSKTSGNVEIDTKTTDLPTLTLATDYELLTFNVQGGSGLDVGSGTGRWAGGQVSNRSLFFELTPPTGWTEDGSGQGTTLDIYCDYSSTTLSLTEPYIDTNVLWNEKTGASASDHTSGTTSKAVTMTSNQLTLYPLTVSGSAAYALSASENNPTCTNCVGLPLVLSDETTFYECVAVAKTYTDFGLPTQTLVKQIGAARLTVTQTQATFGVQPLCLRDLAGIPLVIELVGQHIDLSFSSTSYTIELTVSSFDLALGVSEIPVKTDALSLTGTFTYSTDSLVTITGFTGQLDIAQTLRVYVPNGTAIGTSPISYTVTMKYPESTYSTNHVLFSKTGTFTGDTGGGTLAVTTDADTYLPNQSGNILDFEMTSVADSADNFLVLLGPTGLDLSTTTFTRSSIAADTTVILSSALSGFAGNAIIALETSTFRVDNTAITLQLGNVATPESSQTLSFYAVEAANAAVGSIGSCIAVETDVFSYPVNAASLTVESASMSTCQITGPGSAGASLEFQIALSEPLPIGGVITATIGAAWEPTSVSTCTSSTGDSCSFTSSTLSFTLTAALTSGTKVTISADYLKTTGSATAGSAAPYLASVATMIGANAVEENTSISLECTISAASAIGSFGVSMDTFPNVASLSNVDMLITLSVTVPLPKNAEIEFTQGFETWLVSNDLKDLCWTSFKYVSCQLISDTLTIVTDEDIAASTDVYVYIDRAISLPSTTSASVAITLSAKWESINLASRSLSISFDVEADPQKSISLTTLTRSNDQQGELSDYTFTFTSGADFTASHKLWIYFSESFDQFIGDADNYMLNCDSSKFYLDCFSPQLENLSCTVDHGVLVVDGFSTYANGATIDLTVFNVRNPYLSGSMQAFHVDQTNAVLAYTTSFGSVTGSASPSVLSLKSVEVDSNEINSATTYKVNMYLDSVTISDSNYIIVEFPPMYSFAESSVNCSSSYYSPEATLWQNISSCVVARNKVTYKPVSGSRLFSSSERLELSFYDVINPDWGIKRSFEGWDYDTEDFTVFPLSAYWTERFKVVVTSSDTYSYQSWNPLNSAYVGLGDSKIFEINVNNYNPLSTNSRISVSPGTQTADLLISLDEWPFASEKAVLTPSVFNLSDSTLVGFSSEVNSFTIHQWKNSIKFRVSASRALPSGRYYIQWALNETIESGAVGEKYRTPFSTLLEVCEAPDSTFSVVVSTIPSLYIGQTSMPIRVTLTNAPHSDLVISLSFAFDSTESLSVYPTTLTFTPDVTELYFRVTVDSAYTVQSTSPILNYVIDGSDYESYIQPSSTTLTIISGTPSATTTALLISTSSVTASSVTATFTTSISGVAYWWLGCDGHADPTFSEIKTNSKLLVSEIIDSDPTLNEQLKSDYDATEININSSTDSDIYDFMYRIYAQHCSKLWIDSRSITVGTSETWQADWLYSGTTYELGGYVENTFYGNASTATVVNFSTLSMPTPAMLSGVFANGIVTESTNEEIIKTVGGWLNINPDWLALNKYEETVVDNVKTQSTYEWAVVFDRGNIVKTSADIVGQSDELENSKTTLVSNGWANSTAEVSYSFPGVPSNAVPTATIQTTPSSTTSISATFNITSTSDGVMCGSCSDTYDPNVQSWQVQVGLSSANKIIQAWDCHRFTSTETTPAIEIIGLTPSSENYCSFVVCSIYPLWASCNSEVTLVNVTMSSTLLPSIEYAVGLFLSLWILILS